MKTMQDDGQDVKNTRHPRHHCHRRSFGRGEVVAGESESGGFTAFVHASSLAFGSAKSWGER
jgi:hypothetical protein